MELVPDEAAVCVIDGIFRVVNDSEPVGGCSGTFRGKAELLTAAVEHLAVGIGSVASCSVHIHEELTVVNRQFVPCQLILVVIEYVNGGGESDTVFPCIRNA